MTALQAKVGALEKQLTLEKQLSQVGRRASEQRMAGRSVADPGAAALQERLAHAQGRIGELEGKLQARKKDLADAQEAARTGQLTAAAQQAAAREQQDRVTALLRAKAAEAEEVRTQLHSTQQSQQDALAERDRALADLRADVAAAAAAAQAQGAAMAELQGQLKAALAERDGLLEQRQHHQQHAQQAQREQDHLQPPSSPTDSVGSGLQTEFDRLHSQTARLQAALANGTKTYSVMLIDPEGQGLQEQCAELQAQASGW